VNRFFFMRFDSSASQGDLTISLAQNDFAKLITERLLRISQLKKSPLQSSLRCHTDITTCITTCTDKYKMIFFTLEPHERYVILSLSHFPRIVSFPLLLFPKILRSSIKLTATSSAVITQTLKPATVSGNARCRSLIVPAR